MLTPESSVRLSRRTALGLLGLAGVLAACASPATPSPAPTKPAAQPTAAAAPTTAPPTAPPKAAPTAAPAAAQAPAKLSAPVTWRHAVLSYKFDTAFQLMGVEKGYFKDLNLDLQVTGVTSGDTILKGLVAGEFDSGDFGPSVTFPAIATGAAVKIIGTNNPRVPHVLFGKKEINDLRDLYGRPVGVAAPGAFLHALITATMVKEGLDPDEVDWVNVGSSADVFRAVVGGRVDAGVSSVEFEPEIPPDSDIKLVLAFGPRLPDYVKQTVTVPERHLAQQRDAVIAFATAYTQGHRWAMAHKDETVALAVKLTSGNPEVMSLAYDRYMGNNLIDPNFYISPEAIQFTQELGVQQQQQEAVLPVEQVATWEIQEAVVKALGEQR